MTAFPALIPSSRTFTPGDRAHAVLRSMGGRSTQVRHSNVVTGQQLKLSFNLLTEANMLAVQMHYINRRGQFATFSLPAAIWSGGTDRTISGYSWRYISVPKVEEPFSGRFDVSLTLEMIAEYAPPATTGDAFVQVPQAAVAVAILMPTVQGNAPATVAIPAADVTVAGEAPTVTAGATDPDFANVVLLLQPDAESNGSTTLTDLSPVGNIITVAGNTQISTGTTIFGKPTIALEGDPDFNAIGTYFTAPTGTPFNFGTGNWTVDINMIPTLVVDYYMALFCTGRIDQDWIDPDSFKIILAPSGNVYLETLNVSYSASTGAVSTGALSKIRVSLSSGVLSYRVNGVTDANVGTVTDSFTAGRCIVGRNDSGAQLYLRANITIRVTKGVARTDAEPTAPWPTS